MKRSARFKAEYQLYAQYAATWLFATVFLLSMAYAYQPLLSVAGGITLIITLRWFFDCMNKRRAYRMEVRYEKQKRIKNDTISL